MLDKARMKVDELHHELHEEKHRRISDLHIERCASYRPVAIPQKM